MNLLAIIGSPRKGKTTDALVNKAIEGVIKKSPNASVKRIYLSDHEIGYCKDSLNARTVGALYAGDVWHKGVDHYSDKALRLGQKLI